MRVRRRVIFFFLGGVSYKDGLTGIEEKGLIFRGMFESFVCLVLLWVLIEYLKRENEE